jgi:predicted permease
MRSALYSLAARVRDFVRPAAGDADFDDEIQEHLAMAEEENVRRGMNRDEARRQARIELGGVTQLREAARAARGLPWLESFWLDGKLGVRMLRKSWGLTLVGGLAMAITIGLGASIFTIWYTVTGQQLPLDEGERVVAIQPFDLASQQIHRATPLADFRRWRETLKSVEYVSGMRSRETPVITRDGGADRVSAAEMTASAFQLARVQPVLGRTLIDQDALPGAEPVAVIGYTLWQSGFSSDPAVLGQRIQIADTPHLIVGVMPDGFRFPLNQRLWIPLRIDAGGEAPRASDVFVFARLVPGAGLERAQSEVAALGLLAADAAPAGARLEPRVVPYAAGFYPNAPMSSWIGGVMFLLAALLLIPPCANIAILVYARTVTRRDEFAARTALGASRARIVMQLFVELLVLAAGAGMVGFLIARQFSGRFARIVMPANPSSLPFWMDYRPSLGTVLVVAGLSVIAAAIAGGIPAINATGRWRRSGLWDAGTRTTGARLGKTWMTLLAAQVALSLTILPSAAEMIWGVFQPTIVGPALPFEEFLTGSLAMEGETASFDRLAGEAVRELQSESGITGVTVSSAALMNEPFADIEIDGRNASDDQVKFNVVDERFFDVFGARLLAGRGFNASDFRPGPASAIVNRSFVTEVMEGANVLGRRVRYREAAQTQAAPPPDWHEIVGVVEDFPGNNDGPQIFHPQMAAMHPAVLTVRAPSGAALAAGRVREVAARIDSRLRIARLESLEETYRQRESVSYTFGIMLGAVTGTVLLLSMAGIYTLMTFIVAQRWREIGVRSALGAQPRRLLLGIFGRAAVPLVIGAFVGCAAALRVHSALPIVEAGGRSIPGIVPLSAATMILIGLVAVAGSARRAIRIDPTEALRV